MKSVKRKKFQLNSRYRNSPVDTKNFGEFRRPTSFGCSGNKDDGRFSVDLQGGEGSFEIESSEQRKRRETTPTPTPTPCSSNVTEEELDMERQSVRSSTRRRSIKRMLPQVQVEIEEFFAAVEKDERKRFMDKYNYDIVRDVPLEGRYEWVSVKP